LNILLLILGAVVLFPLAFRIYSWILAQNFGEDPQRTLPAVFMTVTTLAALVFLFQKYLSSHNFILLAADVILFAFAIGLVVIAFRVGLGLWGRSRRPVVAEAPATQ